MWSFQSLGQVHNEQDGVMGTTPHIWHPRYLASNGNRGDLCSTAEVLNPFEMGIWILRLGSQPDEKT